MIDITPLPLDGFDIPAGTTEVSCADIQEILATTDLDLGEEVCDLAAQFLSLTCGCGGNSDTDSSPPPICDVCPDGQFTNVDAMINIGGLPLGDSIRPDGQPKFR